MNAHNIRRRFWWGIRALVVGIIVFVIVGGWNMVERSWFYPYDYRSRIETSAAHYHVDPYLVAAVIKHESKFRPNAKSTGGALGMMQLMPQTAEWIARQMDEPFTEDLAELEREFGGNDILALAAYNAGRGNVREWMERWHWTDQFDEIEAIPYPETRLYVRRVLEDRAHYQRLYDE